MAATAYRVQQEPELYASHVGEAWNPVKKGKEMTSLRQKVLVWVSAIMVTLALVVLPGCGSKKPTPTKTTTKTGAKKDATKGME